jgi:hypothetical protein
MPGPQVEQIPAYSNLNPSPVIYHMGSMFLESQENFRLGMKSRHPFGNHVHEIRATKNTLCKMRTERDTGSGDTRVLATGS